MAVSLLMVKEITDGPRVFRLSSMATQLKGNHKGCPYGKTRIAAASGEQSKDPAPESDAFTESESNESI